jgi:predicted SprT family Zn-dependent metalloprotease
MNKNNPTATHYAAMTEAYGFFNENLFTGLLPGCLITMQRKGGTYGYFAGGRFGTADGRTVTDEIALNPSHFKLRTAPEVLSTLVHEMAHLWQHHYGKVSRGGYHNAQWAAKMREIGLIPSDTGQPGGKKTGQKMTHYIEPGGAFAKHCREILREGFVVPYVELWDEAKTEKSKAKNKTKFICGSCEAAAWGKPELKIVCAECDEAMVTEE